MWMILFLMTLHGLHSRWFGNGMFSYRSAGAKFKPQAVSGTTSTNKLPKPFEIAPAGSIKPGLLMRMVHENRLDDLSKFWDLPLVERPNLQPALNWAASKGNIEIVRFLLLKDSRLSRDEALAFLNRPTQSKNVNREVILAELKTFKDPGQIARDIVHSAEAKDKALQYLLSINSKTDDEILKRNAAVMNALIKDGVPLDSMLMATSIDMKVEMSAFSRVLDEPGIDLSNTQMKSSLVKMVLQNDHEVLEKIMRLPIDKRPNLQIALNWAASKGNIEMVRFLLMKDSRLIREEALAFLNRPIQSKNVNRDAILAELKKP